MTIVFENDYFLENHLLKEIDFRRELIEACKQNDRRAQQKLYSEYSDAMYNVCYRMLQNHADAQDVLQNSFIDVFRNLHKFKYESTPGSWIKRIVVNNCINFFRGRKIHFEELKDYEPPPTIEPEYEAIGVERIKKAISHLPEGYRVVLSLYLFEGYDHAEISQVLDITVSTSKTQYHRAKKKLRRELELIMTD